MKPSSKAIALLILISASWGLTFPLKNTALASISPSIFVLLRFFIATLLMFPFVIRSLKHTTPLILLSGLLLGIINCGIYVFQNIGIQHTPISHAAFITESSVIMVPLLSPLWGLGKPRLINIISALFCLLGIYLLTGAQLSHLNRGDLWVLACAACNALSILTIQLVSKKIESYLLLTFYQILFTSSCMMLFINHHLIISPWHVSVWSAILFCAIFATALALYIQVRYQQQVTATQAAVIFTLEPVFAVFFDAVFYHHNYSIMTLAGATIVILSVLLPTFLQNKLSTTKAQEY